MKKIIVTSEDITGMTEAILYQMGKALADGIIDSELLIDAGALKVRIDINEMKKSIRLVNLSEIAEDRQLQLRQ